MKASLWVVLMAYAVTTNYVRGGYGTATPAAAPILVELFTSEGCSSCPPADAWVQKLDAAQPVPGGQLIVLSEHVDYWNHDGWKDPYSSSALTERQSAYSHALRLNDIYTPQVIVDGTSELRLSNPQRTAQVFQQAAASPTIPVRLNSVSVEAGNAPVVRARVETDAGTGDSEADVYIAVALDHAESQVLRGENSGKRLMHVAVVESLRKLGKLEPGKPFSHDFQVKLKAGSDPNNVRLVAFLQEAGPGKVLGATLVKPPLK